MSRIILIRTRSKMFRNPSITKRNVLRRRRNFSSCKRSLNCLRTDNSKPDEAGTTRSFIEHLLKRYMVMNLMMENQLIRKDRSNLRKLLVVLIDSSMTKRLLSWTFTDTAETRGLRSRSSRWRGSEFRHRATRCSRLSQVTMSTILPSPTQVLTMRSFLELLMIQSLITNSKRRTLTASNSWWHWTMRRSFRKREWTSTTSSIKTSHGNKSCRTTRTSNNSRLLQMKRVSNLQTQIVNLLTDRDIFRRLISSSVTTEERWTHTVRMSRLILRTSRDTWKKTRVLRAP